MTFNAVGTTVGVVTNQASVTSAEVELTPADNVVSRDDRGRRGRVHAADLLGPAGLLAAAGRPATSGRRSERRWLQGHRGAGAAAERGRGVARQRHRRLRTPACSRPASARTKGCILDLNSDGRLDIALEGLSDAFVLFGNGAAGSARRSTYSFAPAIVADVRAGDFNGDGRPDLAIATAGPNALHMLLQRRQRRFRRYGAHRATGGGADRSHRRQGPERRRTAGRRALSLPGRHAAVADPNS